MRDFTDNCIVLKISDYRDDDRLANVLTAENGMATLQFRGVKKAKAKLKPFAQAFAVFNARFTSTRGAFLTPIEPAMIQDGYGLSADLKMYAAASVCAEATMLALGDDEPHPDVFVEMLRFIKSAQFDGDPYYSAITYVCELLKLSGFYREYTYESEPKSPVQMLGYCQRHGYEKREESDMTRRALKYIISEFSKNFDVGLKSIESVDLYK
ncbi:MAG: DNA repair protein RecO [Clostridiales bacterium]|nr:DNA repair protein RecO [Clostridiales bacterium]